MLAFVIDTNVVFSALRDPDGVPARLLELAIEGRIALHAPAEVRAEMERTLRAKLDYDDEDLAALMSALPVRWAEPAAYAPGIPIGLRAIRDPHDAPLVALALALDAPVVSGDKAFHPLREPVVETFTPREALRRIEP